MTAQMPQKQILQTVQLAEKIKVYFSERFTEQVKFLVSKFPTLEWSGILMYATDGDINEPEKFTITLQYIYFMDIGTSGYTEYSLDESFVEFRMNNPDMLKYKIGHIHSHNTMGTFFSSTDMDEIMENSEFYNYYLSIIVNTRLEVTGKIGFRATPDSMFKARKSDGEEYELPSKMIMPYLFVYECEFPNNDKKYNVDSNFINRYSEIVKLKEEKRKKELQKSQEKSVVKTYEQFNHNIIQLPQNQRRVEIDEDDDMLAYVREEMDDFFYQLINRDDFDNDNSGYYFYMDSLSTTGDILKYLSEINKTQAIKILEFAAENFISDIHNYFGNDISIKIVIEVCIEYLTGLANDGLFMAQILLNMVFKIQDTMVAHDTAEGR